MTSNAFLSNDAELWESLIGLFLCQYDCKKNAEQSIYQIPSHNRVTRTLLEQDISLSHSTILELILLLAPVWVRSFQSGSLSFRTKKARVLEFDHSRWPFRFDCRPDWWIGAILFEDAKADLFYLYTSLLYELRTTIRRVREILARLYGDDREASD